MKIFHTFGIIIQRIVSIVLLFCLLVCQAAPTAFAAQTPRASSRTATLTIEYRLRDIGTMLQDPYSATLPVGASYSVESPDSLLGYQLESDAQKTISGTLSGDTRVTVYYVSASDIIEYTVYHVTTPEQATVDANRSDNPITLKTETLRGLKGTQITLSTAQISGYTFDLDTTTRKNGVTDIDWTPTLTTDDHFYLYYKHTDEPQYIYFDTGPDGSYVPSITGRPGDSISNAWIDRSSQKPTRSGYTFDGWNVPADFDYETMPYTDVTITAEWKEADSPFTVMYMMQNLSNPNEYTPMDDAVVQRTQAMLQSWKLTSEAKHAQSIQHARTNSSVSPEIGRDLVSDKVLNQATQQNMHNLYPFFGFEYRQNQEPDIIVNADGSSTLQIYYDRSKFSIYIHDNIEPSYDDYPNGLLGKTEDVRFYAENGVYGANTSLSISEIKAYFEKQYPDRHFLGLSDIAGYASWMGKNELKTYSIRTFANATEIGANEAHYFPIFAKTNETVLVEAEFYREVISNNSSGTPTYILYNSDFSAYEKKASTTSYDTKITPPLGFTLDKTQVKVFYDAEGRLPAGGTDNGSLDPSKVSDNANGRHTIDLTEVIQKIDTETHKELHLKLYLNRNSFDITYLCRPTDNMNDVTIGVQRGVKYGADVKLKGATDPAVIAHQNEIHANYDFRGWALSPALTAIDISITETEMPPHPLTVYARWTPKEYTVTFNANGGQISGSSTQSTQDIQYNSAIENMPTASRQEHIFLGWFTESSGGTRWDNARPVTKPTTLYAHWAPREDVPYRVKHIIQGDTEPFLVEERGSMQGSVTVSPLNPLSDAFPKDYFISTSDTPTTIPLSTRSTQGTDSDGVPFVTFYYARTQPFSYEVKCLEKESNKLLNKETIRTYDSTTTVIAPIIAGYQVVDDDIKILDRQNTSATFYYIATSGGGGVGGGSGSENGGSSGGSSGGGGSSSGDTRQYIIDAAAGTGGSITPSGRVTVAAGGSRSFTIEPQLGWHIERVLVDGKDIGAVSSYTFTNVQNDHTIEVFFSRSFDPAPTQTGVADWLNTTDHIRYLHGYPDGLFRPAGNMTRAEVAQMFYRLLLRPDAPQRVRFDDVPAGIWYEQAVYTLAGHGILLGIGEGRFEPDRAITRAEFTAIAMRFAGQGTSGNNPFSDVQESDWF